MKKYSVTYVGDTNISNVHHLGIECNGSYYSVIFGEYVNGGFFSIPNWSAGGELADFSDVFWNAERISRSLSDKKTGQVIAEAIRDQMGKGKRGNE